MIKDIHLYLKFIERACLEKKTNGLGNPLKSFYKLDDSDYNILSGASNAWRNYFHYGWYSFLFEKNIKAAQQHFYICGRMDEFIFTIGKNEKKNMNVIGYNYDCLEVIHLFTALLSGNTELVLRRWNIKFEHLNKYYVKWYTKVNLQTWLMSHFVSSERAAFDKLIEQFASLPKPEKYLADMAYFKALAIGDIPTMEKAIEEIASSKMTTFRQKFDYKDLNKNLDWSAGIFSWDGILYTKFAKMQGFNLQIKSPLVTIAQPLIDAPQLVVYDDEFDFLKVQMPNGIMRTREEIEALGIKIIE